MDVQYFHAGKQMKDHRYWTADRRMMHSRYQTKRSQLPGYSHNCLDIDLDANTNVANADIDMAIELSTGILGVGCLIFDMKRYG